MNLCFKFVENLSYQGETLSLRKKLWLFYTYNGFHSCCVKEETSGTVGWGRKGGIAYIGHTTSLNHAVNQPS